jgi:16S rRNA (cytosine967-C5)-methyltransferase
VISPARQIGYSLLRQIEQDRVFSDDALNSKIMETVDTRDRHLITEMVYGTLRWRLRLDYLLSGVSSRPWRHVETGARILLRMSLYQMWHMDRIPDHALVNDAVELAKKNLKHGIGHYCNGILRHLARNRPWTDPGHLEDAPKWIRVSLPQWLWKRWVVRYGENAAEEYAVSLNIPPQPVLRLRTEQDAGRCPFKINPSDLVPGAYLQDCRRDENKRNCPFTIAYQDEASQLIPHLLGDIRGLTVWDACAAPGGKTAILCDRIGEAGSVVASDRSIKRVRRIVDTLKDYSRMEWSVIVADAGLSAPFRRPFDAVVVDAPCSGLGTLRRNPEIKWRFRKPDLSSLQKNQLNILRSVSENVRSGGKLLYSTCSTEPEENEQVVKKFLAGNPDFRIEKPASPKGILSWTGKDGMVRTFPGTRLWDGFFAAIMVRSR